MLDIFNEKGEPYEPPKDEPSIPTDRGYPARRDPQADNPTGIITSKSTDVEIGYWRKRHSAPNHNRGYV